MRVAPSPLSPPTRGGDSKTLYGTVNIVDYKINVM